ncbi:hypothetical protein V6D40_05545 [Corynebacterium sp. Q4381]|uniref:hypothetical protein n=1 Tax=Corynebacterium sp. Marseille-Q4381 TaxID=3121597 RepID=UPI002FE67B9B
MKRINKSAIAVALAGALTLGVSPMAGAATPATLKQGDVVFDADGNIVTSFSGTTDGLVVLEDGDVVYDSNSQNVTADRSATAPAAPDAPAPQGNTPATLQPGDLVYDADGNIVTSFSGTDNGYVVLKDGDVVYNSNSENVTAERSGNAPVVEGEIVSSTPVTLSKGDRIVDFAGTEKLVAEADGQLANLEPGDRVVAGDGVEVTNERKGVEGANVPTPVTLSWGDIVVDKDGNVVLTAKANGEYAVLQPGDKVIPAGKIGAGVLGGLGALTLGGILYNVVKNAQGENVLVPADRPDQTPTAEDEKKTEELVQAHADEIADQAAKQNAANGELRGVGANTGNNAFGKGLMTLLLASVLAAAAFVFGRRQLV